MVTALVIAIRGASGTVTAQEEEAQPPEMSTRIHYVADIVVPIRITNRTVDLSRAAQEAAYVHPVDIALVGPNRALARAITPDAPGEYKVSVQNRPNFEPLVDVIMEVVERESWRKAGGAGVMQPSERNRALVVTQTEEAHEQIVDLLEQLRRVLDVEVVIEARFMTAPENLFEEAGLEIKLRRGVLTPQTAVAIGEGGLEQIGVDTDLPFTQGGLPDDLAEIDFAVLPPQQMMTLMHGVQDDDAATLLAAPRITLLNGQRVSIGPASMGDAHRSTSLKIRRSDEPQATNVWLSVEAMVTNDRRNVRLAVSPKRTPPPSAGAAKPKPHSGPLITASANLPGDSLPEPDSPVVRATIPSNCTLLVDGGIPPAASRNGKTTGKRLLLLVTPRIVIRAEEETP